MKIEFVPFKAWHIHIIEERSETREVWIARENAKILERHPAMTMLVDGVIKACGGCVYLWPNTGEFWAVTASDIGDYKKVFNQFVLNLIGDVTKALHLTRLQATVMEDFKIGHRWIEFLGFHFETKMPKYIEDKTYWLYSKIVEG
jgi:hypothetical protein